VTPTRHTSITVDDGTPSIRIVREFEAPASAVFQAHADPELFVQWVGPDALESSTIDRWDCRTGGEWRYVSEAGGQQHWFRGCFHDVRPGELIVQTFTYEGFPDGVALERLVLEALDSRRSLLTATSLLESFEARDAMVASGMETGVVEGYRKLDRLVGLGVVPGR